ncbi:class I SAM-dependent methyltransferase [Hymenobacter convexus]|uniref:class I SAM-dependent methyltransferase n=1 Tax=Hymenobacter sp. CA1UV-4 TaxID=3063782 RepID=UPI002713F6EC|nr:methyltransferase domain-containing protein [Hymenobacter sp. CA1UV-4]MDO7853464.1 methyltransferase domain-containing protein [Hymenobacter sp. CA1UV-4]
MTNTSAPDILGQALLDYHHGHDADATVTVHCSAADDEPLPAAYFFRTVLQMPELERQALDESRGRVLDLGAGAGCHSLELQSRGFDVKAVDVSAGAVQVMSERGVQNVARHDLFSAKPASELPYDTILLLMNGLGLTGTLDGLDKFLAHARTLLAPDGQILATSSDIRYLYEDEDGALRINLNGPYYGEVEYRLTYRGQDGEPFPWLFIDAALLNDAAEAAGYTADFIGEDDNEQYLVRLQIS